jgi:hypothetical protein
MHYGFAQKHIQVMANESMSPAGALSSSTFYEWRAKYLTDISLTFAKTPSRNKIAWHLETLTLASTTKSFRKLDGWHLKKKKTVICGAITNVTKQINPFIG